MTAAQAENVNTERIYMKHRKQKQKVQEVRGKKMIQYFTTISRALENLTNEEARRVLLACARIRGFKDPVA